jgi:hypothetical protein
MKAVPGLNAVHVINGLRVNDKMDELGVPILPRMRVLKIDGWNNRANMESHRMVAVGRSMREIAQRTQLDGKPLVYSGVIEARNQPELEEYIGEVSAAFSSVDELVINVEDYYSDDIFFFRAGIEAFDPPEEPPGSMFVRYPFSRTFTLGLYMNDPRKYFSLIQDVTTGALPPGYLPGSGVLVPFIPPVTLPSADLTVAPPTNSDPNTVIAHNDGSMPTDPIIEVSNISGSTVTFRNESIGTRQLSFSGLGNGSLLVVDFYNRTVLLDGVDKSAALNETASDWWDPGVPGLKPGDNFLRLVSGGTSLRARYYHANN